MTANPTLRVAAPSRPVADSGQDVLRPFLEAAEVRERRRLEAAAELIKEYEAVHGEISADEMRALESEWRR